MKFQQSEVVKAIKEQELVQIGFVIVLGIGTLIFKVLFPPYQQTFYFNDPMYWHPHHEDTVPYWAVWIFSSLFLVVVAGSQYFHNSSIENAIKWLVNGLTAFVINCCLTGIFKNVGEFRPDYAVRCFGPDLVPPQQYSNISLSDWNDCPYYGDLRDTLEYDARSSFPSGHSSMAMSGGIFLTAALLYLAHQMKYSNDKKQSIVSAVLSLVGWLPFCFALFVGGSRILDYRHHYWDVLGGYFIGTICSAVFFWQTVNALAKQKPKNETSEESYVEMHQAAEVEIDEV